jgi:hypothetical protein
VVDHRTRPVEKLVEHIRTGWNRVEQSQTQAVVGRARTVQVRHELLELSLELVRQTVFSLFRRHVLSVGIPVIAK